MALPVEAGLKILLLLLSLSIVLHASVCVCRGSVCTCADVWCIVIVYWKEVARIRSSREKKTS